MCLLNSIRLIKTCYPVLSRYFLKRNLFKVMFTIYYHLSESIQIEKTYKTIWHLMHARQNNKHYLAELSFILFFKEENAETCLPRNECTGWKRIVAFALSVLLSLCFMSKCGLHRWKSVIFVCLDHDVKLNLSLRLSLVSSAPWVTCPSHFVLMNTG